MTDPFKPTREPEGPAPGPSQPAPGSSLGAAALPEERRAPPSEPEHGRAAHLGYLAHEIRNPMSTALWTAELLGRLPEAERGGERGARLAAICLRSLGRVRLLVEDHLLCERLDAGGYPVRPEPVVLSEALEEALARKPADPVAVEVAVAAGLTAMADRALLVRLLEGVVAAAATGAERVQVEARRAGPGLQVRVLGGPTGSLEEPRKGAATDPRGRALALPTARRIAAALQGALTVAEGAYLIAIPST